MSSEENSNNNNNNDNNNNNNVEPSSCGVLLDNCISCVKKRRTNVELEKGLDAFRDDLLRHLEANVRLTAVKTDISKPIPMNICSSSHNNTAPENNNSTHINSSNIITSELPESARQQWLKDYRLKISNYNIKQLVKESIKFRFQCSPYVILVPSWHYLREVLWEHLRKLGIKKPKRSVNTKQELIEICIQDSVKFDFSDCVKEVTSHGNKAKRQKKTEENKSKPIKKPNKKINPLLLTADGLINYVTQLNQVELTKFADYWNNFASQIQNSHNNINTNNTNYYSNNTSQSNPIIDTNINNLSNINTQHNINESDQQIAIEEEEEAAAAAAQEEEEEEEEDEQYSQSENSNNNNNLSESRSSVEEFCAVDIHSSNNNNSTNFQ